MDISNILRNKDIRTSQPDHKALSYNHETLQRHENLLESSTKQQILRICFLKSSSCLWYIRLQMLSLILCKYDYFSNNVFLILVFVIFNQPRTEWTSQNTFYRMEIRVICLFTITIVCSFSRYFCVCLLWSIIWSHCLCSVYMVNYTWRVIQV